MSFVSSVLYYTKDSESPKSYFYWASLAAVSAVLKDKVWVDRFTAGKIYPNIYVLLVGKSGLRKGPPVNLAKYLVNQVNNTKIYAGRVSIQGVVADLSKAKTHENGGPPRTDAHGFLVAPEFSSFIIKDPDALTILTDLYDRHHWEQGWTYLLRNSPEEKLNRPTISMIGASNEIHLRDALPKNAIGGGFIARTCIIHATKKSNVNASVDRPQDTIPLPSLVQELATIAKCQGEFKWNQKAKDIYKGWYERLQVRPDFNDDTTGTMERLHDHVLKTAMLISVARKQDLVLEVDDIRESISVCQSFMPASRRMTLLQAGEAKSAPGTSVLILELISRPEHSITRAEALQKHWAHFSAPELDAIVEDLQAQKAVKIEAVRTSKGIEVLYTLNPEVLKRYMVKFGKQET